MQLTPTESSHSNSKHSETFSEYLTKFKSILQTVFHDENDINLMSIQRGMEPDVLQKIMSCQPMSLVIPTEYGGRGGNVQEKEFVVALGSFIRISRTVAHHGHQ